MQQNGKWALTYVKKALCASAKPWQIRFFAPVQKLHKCKILVVSCANIIQCKTLTSQVYFLETAVARPLRGNQSKKPLIRVN